MKNYSTTPLPDVPVRWKDGEWAHYINHKDNGFQPEGEEGKRYEADFTILRSQEIGEVIHAFTRLTEDPDLDYAVVNNIEVDRTMAILVIRDYPVKVSANIFPALPPAGSLKKGQVFSYGNGAVMVVHDHERTIYPPELTPALFSFHREVTEGQPWIPQEVIALGATRSYDGKMYECIQAHTSLEGWEPDKTLALWKLVIETPVVQEWKQPTGAHDAYNVGDRVLFNSNTYESLINSNVWSPSVYPAGWKKI